MKKVPILIGNENIKYIHDIYETTESELWMASVGMGVIRARIAGTPDNPVLEDVQRYVIPGKEGCPSCCLWKKCRKIDVYEIKLQKIWKNR